MAKAREFYITQLEDFLINSGNKLAFVGDYLKAREKSLFLCNNCNTEFLASPNNILGGKGCPECAGRNWTTEKLQTHLDGLGKSIDLKGNYIDSKTKILSVCRVCSHAWESQPGNLKKNGCPSCSRKIKGSIEKLQNRINLLGTGVLVSGEYKNKGAHVNCHCSICSFEWTTQPSALVRGTSCPSCARTGFNPSKPAYLYYLRVVSGNETFWKIGITGKEIHHRFHAADREKITLLYKHKFENGVLARSAEQNILRLYDDFRVKGRSDILYRAGNTELFYRDVLQMNHLED